MSWYRRCVIPVHLFFTWLGLVSLGAIAARLLTSALAPFVPLQPNSYLLEIFWNPNKPFEIASYGISVVLIFGASAYGIWLCRCLGKRVQLDAVSSWKIVGLLTGTAAVNLLLYRVSQSGKYGLIVGAAVIIPWLILSHWPIWIGISRPSIIPERYESRLRQFVLIAILAILSQVAYTYQPFVFGTPRLINEFNDIPEKTILKRSSDPVAGRRDMAASPAVVNNRDYIFEHKLLNPYPRFNANDHDSLIPQTLRVTVPMSPLLLDIIEQCEQLLYDGRGGELVILDALDEKTKGELFSIVGESPSRRRMKDGVGAAELHKKKFERHYYTAQEAEFIEKNRFEIHWQTLNRWVLSHHNFMFGPANDLRLGRPIKEIHSQYGFLNPWWLVTVANALDGEFTYHRFVQLWYVGYYLFFVAFVLTCWFIFRDVFSVALGLVLTSGFMLLPGFNLIMLGVGANPMRRMLELPVICCLWMALRAKGWWRLAGWILASVLALAQMFVNREFGLPICLALVGCGTGLVLIYTEGTRRIRSLVAVSLGLLAALACYVLADFGAAGQSGYYLRGVLAFPVRNIHMLLVLAFEGLAVVCLAAYWSRSKRSFSPLALMALFLLLYGSMALSYYIVMSTKAHLWPTSSIFVLLGICLFKLGFDRDGWRRWQSLALTVLIVVGLVFDATALGKYFLERRSFNKIFTNHVTHIWDFPKMRAESTMDPAPFREAVDLIKRYNKGPGVHIISKYDMILPFLAGRYSAMPWHILSEFMITQKETAKAIDAIRQARPEILFVDSDIDRPYRSDIIPNVGPLGYLHNESRWRVQRLELLQQVFRAVAGDYEPIERSDLITAWRRRDPVNQL